MVTAAARAWKAWESFLTREVDPARLAVMRIAFGAYLIFYYVDMFSFLHLYYFPPALLPPHTPGAQQGWCALDCVPYVASARYLLYALTLAGAAALAVGFHTRVAALLCWILNAAWTAFQAGQNSGDNVVSVVCFLFLVAAFAGHAQRVWAWDAPRAGLAPARVPAWTLRMFQIQLVLIYFFSGFHKAASDDWYRGEALYYVFQQTVWLRLDLSWLTSPVLIGLLTYGTLLFELLIFPVLIWPASTRFAVLVGGLILHAGIAATMRVFVFGWIMPILSLAFFEPRPLVERFLRWAFPRAGTSTRA